MRITDARILRPIARSLDFPLIVKGIYLEGKTGYHLHLKFFSSATVWRLSCKGIGGEYHLEGFCSRGEMMVAWTKVVEVVMVGGMGIQICFGGRDTRFG